MQRPSTFLHVLARHVLKPDTQRLEAWREVVETKILIGIFDRQHGLPRKTPAAYRQQGTYCIGIQSLTPRSFRIIVVVFFTILEPKCALNAAFLFLVA